MHKLRVILLIAIVTVVLGVVVTAGTLHRRAAVPTSEEITAAEPDNDATPRAAARETLEARNASVEARSEHAAEFSSAIDDDGMETRASGSAVSSSANRGSAHSEAKAGRETVFESASADFRQRGNHSDDFANSASNGRGAIGGGSAGISGTSGAGGAGGVIGGSGSNNGGNNDGGVSTGKGGPAAPAPVPEPGTMALFGSGLVVVGGMLRRRRAAAKK